jgi:hypothetical protein
LGDHERGAILQVRPVLQKRLGDVEGQRAGDARVEIIELAVGGKAVARKTRVDRLPAGQDLLITDLRGVGEAVQR